MIIAQDRDPDDEDGQQGSGVTDENDVISLDRINREIIDLMIADPGVTQVEVAKKLGMSQSSVAVRIDKLRRSALISLSIGLNIERLGLTMSRVDIATSDVEQLLQWAEKCPLFVNSSLGIGGENISLFLVSEDLEMFQYLVEYHIRKIHGVSGLVFNPILRWTKDERFPLSLGVPKRETPPCGTAPYCPRCPANPSYNGKIWADGQSEDV